MQNQYQDKEKRKALALEIAREAMVLLKNDDGMLPLPRGKKAAVFGRTQGDIIIGGSGSGASMSSDVPELFGELERAGIIPVPEVREWYEDIWKQIKEEAGKQQGAGGEDFLKQLEGLVASGLIYELFGKYTAAVPEEMPEKALWEKAAAQTDTAIVFIGRKTGGEECDRRVEDDYLLMSSEKALLDQVCRYFPKVAVICNVNGLIDFTAFDAWPEVRAILFMGPAGEQGTAALADLLSGKVSPSGKLNQTAALRYEDYPTAEHFSCNKDKPETILTYESYGLSAEENGSTGFDMSPVTVYREDVFMGYRYFDSFEKEVRYPFGFGLSYAEFAIETGEPAVSERELTVTACVKNLSEKYSGKEAVQLYIHAPSGALSKPRQELKAFAKTPCLAPGEACTVELHVPAAELASFSEERMAYLIEAGTYTAFIGSSSRDTKPAFQVIVPEEIVTRTVTADIGIRACNRDKLQLLKPEKEPAVPVPEGLPVITVKREDAAEWNISYKGHTFPDSTAGTDNAACNHTGGSGRDAAAAGNPGTGEDAPVLADVKAGKISMEAFVSRMSVRELAVLCAGYGSGLPFSGLGHTDIPVTIKDENGNDIGTKTRDDVNLGYCNPAITKYGILTTWYKDGPASVGMTAWPVGMMIACTFNPELAYAFGSGCGAEAEILKVDSWLAPGMNLVRNPIEGRCFEYFGEDPLLSGVMGREITRGAMENSCVSTCLKHFALNEQETYRRGSAKKKIDAADSIVSARAAREFYLKPFEMVITQSSPMTVMTSFNKLNGSFAGGNKVLCTEILRGEWGYDGVVVTDWGDMDIVVDGADAVHAGNDVVMPGGPPVIEQILKGYEEGRVSLNELREAALHLLNYVASTKAYDHE